MAGSRSRLTPPTPNHQIDIRSVDAKCETPGHKDLEIVCSCTFIKRIPHGDREQAQTAILYHRLAALEEWAGMNIKIEWQPGS